MSDAIKCENFIDELLSIVNESISGSTMPLELKISTVTPINKIANPQQPEDLRPINNLPVIEKIIESAIYKQLIQHIKENDILNNGQFGFRENHSTESAILSVMHDWIEGLEDKKNNNKIIAVFLDMKRAFETVDRQLMLEKLRKYGLIEKAVDWFKSYLTNRAQRVKVNSEFSSPIDVNYGLPQGSKLSNLLFILFINDMILNTQGVELNLYADDALLYIISDDIGEATNIMNVALDSISDWLRFNRMAINAKKCNALVLNHDPEMINITIDDEIIQIVEHVKYLGVILDNQLNFIEHVDMVKRKINKRVGLLSRLSNKMTFESKKIFLKSLILPLYDNCWSILTFIDDKMITQIQRCVNKAMRIVLKADRRTNVESMMKNLEISSVHERIIINSLKFVNKHILKGVPIIIASKFKSRKDVRPVVRELRNNNSINLPNWSKSTFKRSIFYNGVVLYNDMMTKFKNDEKFNENCVNYVKSINM